MALTKTPIELSSTPSIVDGGNATAITIDSSENVLVNRTSVFTTAKMEIQSDAGDASTLSLNSINTDGSILEFYKAGTTVGSIGTLDGNSIYIGNGDVNLRMIDVTDDIRPVTSAGTNRDAAVDLGDANARFKDLYLSGGAYLGGTGSANKLDDYEEGTWTPTITNSTGSYITQVGRYTKIGNLVYVNCNVKTAFTNTGTTPQSIAGLPFTSENVANLFSVGTVFPVLGFNQGNLDIAGQCSVNNVSVALYTVSPSTGINYTSIVGNTFGTTVEFEFSLCYKAA